MKKGLPSTRWMCARSRILLAEQLEVVGEEVAQAFGIGRLAVGGERGMALAGAVLHRALRADAADEEGQDAQLHRAFDPRVAGQDLLDQRRARARQADDEDRIAPLAARPLELGEVFRREQRLAVLHVDARHLGVVAERRALERVAFLVALERGRVIGLVLQRLAEREADLDTALDRQVGGGEQRPHRLDLGVLEAEGFEVGQRPIGLADLGEALDDRAIGRDRILAAPGGAQGMGIGEPRPRRLGDIAQHDLVFGRGAFVVADPGISHRLEAVMVGIGRLERDQAVGMGEGVVAPVQHQHHRHDGVAGGDEVGGDLEAAREQLLGFLMAVEAQQRLGEHRHRGDVVGAGLQVLAQDLFRRLRPPLAQGRHGLLDLRIFERGVGGVHGAVLPGERRGTRNAGGAPVNAAKTRQA